MKFGLFFILMVFVGCSDGPSWNSFDKIGKKHNDDVIQFNYIGKDTFKIVAVSIIDSNHIYRLKSNEVNSNRLILSISTLRGVFDYYMDSSTNGGKDWSDKN